jgi:hypothetical protein
MSEMEKKSRTHRRVVLVGNRQMEEETAESHFLESRSWGRDGVAGPVMDTVL